MRTHRGHRRAGVAAGPAVAGGRRGGALRSARCRKNRAGQGHCRGDGRRAPGHVAVSDEKAREEFWPRYLEVIRHYSKIRGFAVPTKESFLHEVGPHGALYVGSPETVAQKIAANLTALGATRFDLKYGMGGLAHQALMTNIELYGTHEEGDGGIEYRITRLEPLPKPECK